MRLVVNLFAFLGLLTSLGVAAIVAAAFLVLFGDASIDGCAMGAGQDRVRPAVDRQLAAAFQSKWDDLGATLESGAPASISFSNAEATSRANTFLGEDSDRIEDVALCFEPGKARGSATVKDVLGRDIDIRVEGSLDFSGASPELRITSLHAGRLPLVGPLKSALSGLVNDQLKELRLDHHYDLAFDYDKATVNASP